MDPGRRQEEGYGKKTNEDMKEDLETMGIDWSDARDAASDRAGWRQLVARCSAWKGRN